MDLIHFLLKEINLFLSLPVWILKKVTYQPCIRFDQNLDIDIDKVIFIS